MWLVDMADGTFGVCRYRPGKDKVSGRWWDDGALPFPMPRWFSLYVPESKYEEPEEVRFQPDPHGQLCIHVSQARIVDKLNPHNSWYVPRWMLAGITEPGMLHLVKIVPAEVFTPF